MLAADGTGLRGLWFDGQKYFARDLSAERIEQNTPALTEAKRWLDIYFAGKEPDFLPPLHPAGSAFRQSVLEILLKIPYGQTITYGDIARQLAARRGLANMSAQAVGGAVGHNEISVIIPCHRVVGANGSLTGYAGGIDKKIKLLELERADMAQKTGRCYGPFFSKIYSVLFTVCLLWLPLRPLWCACGSPPRQTPWMRGNGTPRRSLPFP